MEKYNGAMGVGERTLSKIRELLANNSKKCCACDVVLLMEA